MGPAAILPASPVGATANNHWLQALAARPLLVVALAFLTVLSPSLFAQPVHTGDPVEYYAAARCVAERLVCAAHDHWSARWPVFAPTGLLFGVLGENRFTIALAPLIHAFAAILLFTAILNKTFGRGAALVGGLLLAATPLISELSLEINADMLELAFLLAAVLMLIIARERDRLWQWLGAGALLALAVETRTTSVVTGAIIGCALLYLRWPFSRLMLVAAGGLIVLAASSLSQYLITGDALHTLRLAIAHTDVPTTELPAGTDTSGGPFFNLELIKNWRRQLHIHWIVDPVANLLVNSTVGLTYSAALLLILLGRAAFGGAALSARALRLLAVCSGGLILTISFVLSIHPTPRMFLPMLAAVCALAAILVTAVRADLRKAVLLGLIPLLMLQSFVMRLIAFDPVQAETVAAAWLSQEPGPVSTNQMTRRHLHHIAAVRHLREDEGEGEGSYLILAPGTCHTSELRGSGWQVGRAEEIRRNNPGLIAAVERTSVGIADAGQWSLCLFER